MPWKRIVRFKPISPLELSLGLALVAIMAAFSIGVTLSTHDAAVNTVTSRGYHVATIKLSVFGCWSRNYAGWRVTTAEGPAYTVCQPVFGGAPYFKPL